MTDTGRRGDSSCWTDVTLAEYLTCDRLVTYSARVSKDDDRVFKALADPTRRFLLDRLFERDGRTLTELESELEMTRFGVMKHLRVLEDAGLVVTRRQGREKLHFLNPVPIRLIHDRWIDKYTERQVSALADLKTRAGGDRMTTTDRKRPTQVYQVFIKATPEQIWDAITKPEFTSGTSTARARVDLTPGRPYRARRTTRISSGRGGGARGRSAATPRAQLALALRPRDGGRGAEPRHVGDRSRRTAGRAADGRPRPARGRRRRRPRASRGGLDVRPQRLKTLLETGEPL